MATAERMRELDALATPRAGIVGRSALLAGGWSAAGIDRAISGGQLIRVTRGVYRVAGSPPSRRSSQLVALTACAPDGALARRSAAELHGLAEVKPGPLQLVIPHRRKPPALPTQLAHVTRSRTLRAHEVVERDGLQVTSPARTLLDLAPGLSSDALAETIAAGLRLRLLDAASLDAVLHDHPAAPGRARLRAAIELLGSDGHLSLAAVEIAALAAIVDAGLPRPVVGYRIEDRNGVFVAEVDLAYPQHLLALEIDGYRWHSTPGQKLADEQRQNRIVLAGWTVLRFSATVVRREPHVLVSAVSAALDLG